nr:hypothetical protein [uncultured Methylotenera sp.]
MSKPYKFFLFFVGVIVCFYIWFYYGAGLSEETSYKLALDRANQYSKDNFVNLNNYTKPELGHQTGSRLFTFTWNPKKSREKPFSVIVDPVLVEVYLEEEK